MLSKNTGVVVTGSGLLWPLGLNVSTSWEGLAVGECGIDYIILFDAEQ